jgi:hypothetical protein
MTIILDGFSKDEIADNLMLFLFAGYAHPLTQYAAASHAANSYTSSAPPLSFALLSLFAVSAFIMGSFHCQARYERHRLNLDPALRPS